MVRGQRHCIFQPHIYPQPQTGRAIIQKGARADLGYSCAAIA